jgi:tRNA threonylcarbamoyladenosine modification (KEOPS) complex  Pcc1 subunit
MTSADAATYSAHYELMPDLLGGAYGQYLADFDSEGPHAPAALRDLLLDAGQDTPKVFLHFCGGGVPRIRVVHRITRYAPTLGIATEWDGSVFAMASDVGPGNQVTWVHFPAASAFARTGYVRVPMADRMTESWTASPAAALLGPFAEATQGTESVRTRFFTPVPKDYIPLVMQQPDGWAPRELWEQLGTAIVADQRLLACAPLLKWLRVASTFSFGAAVVVGAPLPSAPPAVTLDPLVAPVADAGLQRRLWAWLISDLPALSVRSGTNDTVMTDTLLALKAEFSLQRVEAAAARVASKKATTLSEKFPEASGGLRLLCEVTCDEALPPFWTTYATLGKKEGFFALGQALDARAEHAGSMGHAPMVTPQLYERISNFAFGSRNVDDLTAGLSPFLMTSGLGADAQSQRQNATVYQMMYAGAAAPAIEQVLPLLSSAPAMPASMLAMQISLKNYSVLLDVVLGVNHRVSADFRRFVHSWDRVTLEVEASFGDQIRAWIPRFLRYIQLCMVQYFNLASSVGTSAPLPPLNQLIHHVQMRNWPALPPLPAGYVADLPPARPGVTPALPPPPGGQVPPPSGNNVTNLHSDSALVAHFQRGNTGLRNLTTHANARPLPTADGSTTQLCLAFALRGNCSSDCSRSATHRLLTAPERTGIAGFLVRVGVA